MAEGRGTSVYIITRPV